MRKLLLVFSLVFTTTCYSYSADWNEIDFGDFRVVAFRGVRASKQETPGVSILSISIVDKGKEWGGWDFKSKDWKNPDTLIKLNEGKWELYCELNADEKDEFGKVISGHKLYLKIVYINGEQEKTALKSIDYDIKTWEKIAVSLKKTAPLAVKEVVFQWAKNPEKGIKLRNFRFNKISGEKITVGVDTTKKGIVLTELDGTEQKTEQKEKVEKKKVLSKEESINFTEEELTSKVFTLAKKYLADYQDPKTYVVYLKVDYLQKALGHLLKM